MSEDKPIIEEISEKREEKREAVWNQKEEAKVKVLNVYSMMNEHQPEHNPLGYYEGDSEWNTELLKEEFIAKGWIENESRGKSLIMACSIASNSQIEQQIESEFSDDEVFNAECFVLEEAKESSKSIVRNFIHPRVSIYVYDVAEKELIYNEEDKKTKLFSPWFGGGEPISITELVKETVGGKEIFETEDLKKSPLKLERSEARRLLEDLKSDDLLIEISEAKEQYAFH